MAAATVTTSSAAITSDTQPQASYTGAGATPHIDADADEKVIRERLFGTPYEPNEALWAADQRRWVADFANGGEREKQAYTTLKERGLPLVVNGPAVWNGRDLQKEPSKWVTQFTSEQKAEIDRAVLHFKSLPEAKAKGPYDFDLISQKTFPLPTLGSVLYQAADEILNGIGFRVFRGLEPHKWDRSTQIIAYAGIGSYIGETRLKQHDRRALIHLRDITRISKDERPVIALKGQTSGNQVAHTDAGDIVGLFTLSPAAKGGLSQLSSVGGVYNWLAQHRPDILVELTEPSWVWAGQEATPILHWWKDRVLAQYARRPWFPFFESGRRGDSPELPYNKHIALDALHFTAANQFLNIDLQEGDISFVNNLQTFHARNSSEDDEDQVRHLLRLWLRNEDKAVSHPPVLNARWEGLLDNSDLRWPLEAWTKLD